MLSALAFVGQLILANLVLCGLIFFAAGFVYTIINLIGGKNEG